MILALDIGRQRWARMGNDKVFFFGGGLHPGRLTWNLVKMMVWKMIFLFNLVIFWFHVDLPGCTDKEKGPSICHEFLG